METPDINSKLKISYLIKIVLPACIFGILFIKLISAPKAALDIATIMTGTFSVLATIALMLHDYPILKDNYLIVKSLLGFTKKKIPFADINSYIEYQKGGRRRQWNELKVFAKHDSYVISSYTHRNYHRFKVLISSTKPYNHEAEENLQSNVYKILGIILILLGLLISAFFSWVLFNRTSNIHNDNWALIVFLFIGLAMIGFGSKMILSQKT